MANLTFVDSHNMVAYLKKSTENADFTEMVDFLNANPIDETVHEEREDRVEKTTTITTSLDAKQDSGTINKTQSMAIPDEPIPQRTGSSGSLRCQDTILGDRPAQNRVLALKNNKTAWDLEITLLKKRVKRLEKKKKSRTLQLKRTLFKGRYGHDTEINTASTSITTASINITTAEPVTTVNTPITTTGVSVSAAEPCTPPITTPTVIEDAYLTIAQTFMKMRSEKSNEKAKERGSKEKSSETATRPTKGVTMREAGETTTRPTIPPQQKLDLKDKGKGKMVEPEKPLKRKDQIEFDEEDDVQAMMDADNELAERLQAEEQGELSIEERSKLFVELMNQRKKHFVRLRAEEKRRKPPTKAQKRNQMCTYLKNMAGFTYNQLKNKSFKEVRKAFENTMSWINYFVSIVNDRAEGSSKRAGEELESEKSKNQKLDEKNIDREDLETLWKLVKAKYGNTRPEEAYEKVLWGDLKVMFEPDIKSEVWRKLQGNKVTVWKLFSLCGVHFMRFQNLHIFMLVEKRGSGSSKARDKSHVSVLQKDSTTYASNGNEESAIHGESMSFGSEVTSLVHNQDDLNHFSADVQFGGGKKTLLSNDDNFHVTTTTAGHIDNVTLLSNDDNFHVTTTTAGHIDNVVSDSGRNSTPKSLDLERIEVTCDNVADQFGVSLALIKDINDLTRRMEAGDCDEVLGGLSKDERSNTNDGPTHSGSEWNNATPLGDSLVPIKCLLEKFLADMLNLADANADIDFVPNPGTPIVQSVSIPKPVSYARAARALRALSTIPNKGRSSFARCLIEVSADVVLKDSVTINIPLPDVSIPKPVSYARAAGALRALSTIPNKGRSSFARCLIEVSADVVLKDSVTINIPLHDGEDFTKETKVSYQPKAHENLPKNSVPKVSSSTKDAPSKKLPTSKGGFHVPTNKPSVLTSNPYDVLDDIE
nr:hypothetical protein [Tanacetum cinerariifolium]